ncbi:hypothetical protein B0H17DRAFT_47098 [Mycena rosella]|uniref:Uncharacterized protein n=1 Tax=Mycena rosella TaxID=1033263 RepID=A0AAD7GEU9_MYCRO|nr:hypothetical protein B0H17DRAFT_47098 [Mycena rosella]
MKSGQRSPPSPKTVAGSNYDQIHRDLGIPGVLATFQKDHGTAPKTFTAAHKFFAETTYEEVAPFFHIKDPFEDWSDLEVPQVLFPASVLQDVSKRAFRPHISPPTAAFLAGPFQTIVCLFGGVLRHRPVPGTALSSGGRIEGEVFCREERLLLVRELKHVDAKFTTALAPVLCELFAAWQHNRTFNKDVDPKLRRQPIHEACPCKSEQSVDRRPRFGVLTNRQLHVQCIIARLQRCDPSLLEQVDFLREGRSTDSYATQSYCRLARDSTTRRSHRTVVTPSEPPLASGSRDGDEAEGWLEAVKLGLTSSQWFQRAGEFRADTAAEEGLKLLHERSSLPPSAPPDPDIATVWRHGQP